MTLHFNTFKATFNVEMFLEQHTECDAVEEQKDTFGQSVMS